MTSMRYCIPYFQAKIIHSNLILLSLWLSQFEVAHFPHLSSFGICHLVGLGGGDSGVGYLSILLEVVNAIPSSILH